MNEERILKSNFLMKVTQLEKIVDEDNKEHLKVSDTKWIKVRAKEFEESLYFDRIEGKNHKILIVTSEPDKFQLNTVYIRADGKRAWTYIEKEN